MNRAEKRRQQKLAEKASKGKTPVPPAVPVQGPRLADCQPTLDLAVQHHSAGRLEEAAALYKQVLTNAPNHPVALHLLGATCLQTSDIDTAVELIGKALAIDPTYVDAHSNLGLALHKQGKLEEAVACFEKALSLKPDFAEAHCNMGVLLNEMNRGEEARACFLKALSLKPGYLSAHFNLANTLRNQGNFEQAIDSYRKAIALNPNYAEAYVNMGIALQGLERADDALASYRKAMEIRPDYAEAHSILIFIQDFLPRIDQVEQQAERKRWNEKFIRPLAAKIQPHTNERDPDRRLRIGYVSADFRRHSAFFGFGNLIINHDRENFDIFCYSANHLNDEVTQSLRDAASAWREIRFKRDEDIAQIIRDDAIDILVDLSGHTIDNRLKVFGRKPAPLQLTGIGHLSSGLSSIDYRFTTELMTPPHEENIYPEMPIYLNSYCDYIPFQDSPPVAPSPYMKNGFLTFGFLGRFSKATEELLSLWGKILRDIPHSRLLLKFSQLDNPTMRQSIKDMFSGFGISEDRLILLGSTSQREHLEAHNLVDIVFDTYPHGGGITTLEGLWMGIPSIGLVQENKIAGRLIDFINSPIGLEQWVARSSEEYHDIAVDWASRKQELSSLREGLRECFSDVYSHFHKDVEKSYRLIWQRWCRGEKPSPLRQLS